MELCFNNLCSRQHLQNVEYRSYNRLISVESTISNSLKVQRAKFLGSDGVCFISIHKSGSFKNPSLSELYFRFRRFIQLVELKGDFYELWQQQKQLKTIEMSGSWPRTQGKGDIYNNSNLNPLTKFITSSRSTEFKNILPWNICQMITRIVCQNVDGNWDKNMIRISQWGGGHCRINISIRRKKYIQKSSTKIVTIRDSSKKVLHLSNLK